VQREGDALQRGGPTGAIVVGVGGDGIEAGRDRRDEIAALVVAKRGGGERASDGGGVVAGAGDVERLAGREQAFAIAELGGVQVREVEERAQAFAGGLRLVQFRLQLADGGTHSGGSSGCCQLRPSPRLRQ